MYVCTILKCTSLYGLLLSVHVYMGHYNTARYFARFPLDSLAVYIVRINGLFIYLHGSRVEPYPIDAFNWL